MKIRSEVSVTEEPDAGKPHVRDCMGGAGQPVFLPRDAMKGKFNKNHKVVLDAMLLQKNHVKSGKMFGYPAYYVGRKLCICLYEQGVGVKVPETKALALLERDNHVVPFQPMGKAKMKEWIQINLQDSEEYRKYTDIFIQSIEYLLELQGIKS